MAAGVCKAPYTTWASGLAAIGSAACACPSTQAGMEAEIRSHHRQQAQPAGIRQRTGSPIYACGGQSSLGVGYHLYPHGERLVVFGRRTGLVFA